MGHNKRLLSVVMIVTCLVLLGMVATGFSAQQTNKQQTPAVQQTTPLKATTAPVQISARLGASPDSYSGNCPALITFKGHITVNQPTTVQYKFIRSDNASAPVQTLTFAKAGTQEVTTTWQLGGPSLPTYSGWEAIEVTSPVSVKSNKADFKIRCAGEGQQGGTEPDTQLSDLAIVDITLNQECFVVVTVKNNGPGAVPDKVWTDHAPDSCAVYLHINGKKWGGQSIWGFDAAKGLKNPGGTATMTSNLKVTGTATIEAEVDHTHKVRETNESNNVMKKEVTCRAITAVQPGVVAQLEKLPDLTVEDITLNKECFVVVTVKNNGPGAVPDAVWTEHTPDSSSVYLYINGKKWGGETIWHFDTAKNLKNPGGTATMTSNLKVTGAATIEADIDLTHKVKETDEKNNAMKKELTCKTSATTQPGVVVQPGVTTQPVGTVQPAVGKEDCISFNPATTTAQQIQGSWKVVDGSHWMFDFGTNKAEAEQTLAIIKNYRMNQSCFVGRPNASFQYMLVSGNSPAGAFAGEDCVSFNPATTTVQQIQGSWKVVDGSHWIFDFGNKESEAKQTLAIIKKYGFTRSCYVGRPGPSFSYLRK
jgi:hypothetical protein